MTDIILHHYPQSPVTEKVRVVLGMKSLSWQSVEIPRIPPRPLLMPLAGGYRRTPVMQIGADIYCDSLCIIRELERRHASPGLFPGSSEGIAWAMSRWTDDRLFPHAITVVLGSAENLPADFAADRGRLYFGAGFQLAELQGKVENSIVQLNSQFALIDKQLNTAGAFMLGRQPGLVDALVYYLVWFLRGRWNRGETFLAQFPALERWESEMQSVRHGTSVSLSAQQALKVARTSVPEPVMRSNENIRWNSIQIGDRVSVVPDGDGGDPRVEGTLEFMNEHTICISRDDPEVGRVNVHFPLFGYAISRNQK